MIGCVSIVVWITNYYSLDIVTHVFEACVEYPRVVVEGVMQEGFGGKHQLWRRMGAPRVEGEQGWHLQLVCYPFHVVLQKLAHHLKSVPYFS